MQKILTVVVPAYNAERYIKTNLDSLCRPEVLKALEVIVVDDGSTDATGSLADCYQERYSDTVKVIHKENGGHGSGINCGIEMAAGRYFKVVDADDWVDVYAFRQLMDFLEQTNADAIISGFYWAYDDGSGFEGDFRRQAEIKEPFHGVMYRKNYVFDDVADQIYIKMHGLTIRTEILQKQKIRIDENCFYVDTEYTLFPIPHIRTISFIEDFVYQYRIGRSGQSVEPGKMIQYQENYDRVLNSLFCFYEQCRNGTIVCSSVKCSYIARMIARVATGKIKILLSFPVSREQRNRLIAFERMVHQKYPEIYLANGNRAVKLLRASRYFLYPAAVQMLRMKNRR